MPAMHNTKTVIVTPQLVFAYRNGGIGTFTGHFINVLVNAGCKDLTVIYTMQIEKPTHEWMPYFEERGVKVMTLWKDGMTYPDMPHGYDLHTYLSEKVYNAIPPDTDVVYFADWMANGLIPARMRRFKGSQLPVSASVLHGPSQWHRQGQYLWPSQRQTLTQEYCERYAIEHSDFVAAPSQYTFDWAEQNYWNLPERRFALGYPWLPGPGHQTEAEQPPAPAYKRILFFGRIERRKGIDLFADALLSLKGSPALSSVEEIVLLGQEGAHPYGKIENLAQTLTANLNIPVNLQTKLDTLEAQQYLRERAADSLVVVPSRAETFGFTIVECSLIPGLNVIFADAGGTTEILKESGSHQVFEPLVKPLTAKLYDWLTHGPRSAAQLGSYDWHTANQRWLDFHETVCQHALNVKSAPRPTTSVSKSKVDVCIPFYNLGRYLPYCLESLTQQTVTDFNVYVVNDGSTDAESQEVFEAMKQKYRQAGWYFADQENQGVCAARNNAAAMGNSQYMMFVDADNYAAPFMVERFRDYIEASQDDVLTCWMYVFKGEFAPYIGAGIAKTLIPAHYLYIPVGNDPVSSLLLNAYGDVNAIMRREAFEAIQGFTMDYPKHVNREDQELLTRFSLEGYKVDIIPEYLFYYRYRDDSRLRSTELYLNDMRVLHAYQDKLHRFGMASLAPLVMGLNYAYRDALTGGGGTGSHFRSEDGSIIFNSQHEYLVNGVRWRTLLKAMQGKIAKNVRRVLNNR